MNYYRCNKKTCGYVQDFNPSENKNKELFGMLVKKILKKKGQGLRCPSCILQVSDGKREIKDIGSMKSE